MHNNITIELSTNREGKLLLLCAPANTSLPASPAGSPHPRPAGMQSLIVHHLLSQPRNTVI